MNAPQSVFKQFNPLAVLFQLGLLGLFSLALYFIDPVDFFFFAILAFVGLSLLLRFFVPWHHRLGLHLCRRRRFAEALDRFEKSYRFFKSHPWVDRLRFVTIMDSSRRSYTEQALLNRAFCLSMIGRPSEAIRLYQSTLEEFPESDGAKRSLQLMM